MLTLPLDNAINPHSSSLELPLPSGIEACRLPPSISSFYFRLPGPLFLHSGVESEARLCHSHSGPFPPSPKSLPAVPLLPHVLLCSPDSHGSFRTHLKSSRRQRKFHRHCHRPFSHYSGPAASFWMASKHNGLLAHLPQPLPSYCTSPPKPLNPISSSLQATHSSFRSTSFFFFFETESHCVSLGGL